MPLNDRTNERLDCRRFICVKNGYHERRKTTFDEHYCAWKYAVRGNTLDNLDVRIIIGFVEE